MAINAAPAEELIPGYVATERLGAGGYGEVWKVEAPGGLHKAIKIIYGFHDEERASRELKSLDHVRKVRHPFLLSLERIEVIDGRLMIVTELADMSLMDRFEQCRKANLPGIPREELINHMRDTSDALDFMFQTHSLQHLDVKPENLLLVSGRAKVADFGLVKEIADKTRSLVGAMTPTYAAPEVFDGRATRQSDQYSLAIVYQEMLTGVLPFPGRTAAQLAAQHTRSRPQLSALPLADRDIIARALSKQAGDRFPSCRDMVDALVAANRPVVVAAPSNPAHTHGDRHDIGTRAVNLDDTRTTGPIPGLRPKSTPPEQRTEIIAERKPTPKPPSTPKRLSVNRPLDVPEVVVTTQTIELPPPDSSQTPAGIRPTFFIAAGGTGALALHKLRERLNERFTTALANEAFPKLLVDTDSQTVKKAMNEGLDNQDAALLALKQSSEYRGESDHLLQWIGRRWLYNIPKSAHTTGFRPFGRLALIDRAGQVVVKLRQRLTKLTSGAAAKALSTLENTTVREDVPRVVLFGSCCGGTGGGMLLELAYAVRNIAKQLGNKPLEVCAVVTTSTLNCATSKQLATANTVAFMQELQHYARCGAQGENGADSRTAMFEGPDFPLDQVYFVNLGDNLEYEAYDQQLERLADYLYCDTATPLATQLAAGRQAQPEEELHADLKVRSLRIARFEGLDGQLLPALAAQIAAEVARRWLAEGPRGGVARYLESQTNGTDAPPSEPPSAADKALEKLTHAAAYVGFVSREQPAEVAPELRTKPAYLKQVAAFEWMRKELLLQLQAVSSEVPAALSWRELAGHFPRGFDVDRLKVVGERGAALSEQLLTEYIAQLRKLADTDHQSVHGLALTAVLHKVAQREALTLLKQLVPEVEPLTTGGVRRSPTPVLVHLAERTGSQQEFGCSRRTYLLAPATWNEADVPAFSHCILLRSHEPHAYVCEELQDISLAQLAALHAEKDVQALEAIEHLHSRIDIQWSELATPILAPATTPPS